MKYDEVKQSIREKLKKAEFILFTTEMWTGCHGYGYISLPAHFVGDNWEIHHHCLQTRKVVSSHTAHNLAEEVHYHKKIYTKNWDYSYLCFSPVRLKIRH